MRWPWDLAHRLHAWNPKRGMLQSLRLQDASSSVARCMPGIACIFPCSCDSCVCSSGDWRPHHHRFCLHGQTLWSLGSVPRYSWPILQVRGHCRCFAQVTWRTDGLGVGMELWPVRENKWNNRMFGSSFVLAISIHFYPYHLWIPTNQYMTLTEILCSTFSYLKGLKGLK